MESRYQRFFGLDPALESFLASMDPNFSDHGFHPGEPNGYSFRVRSTANVLWNEAQSANFVVEASSSHGFFGSTVREFGDVVSLERASFTHSTSSADLTLGKQAFTWGSGLLLNPTDLFYQSSPGDPWQERPGVWALRHVTGITDESSLTLALAVEQDCCDVVAMSRYEITLGMWDMAGMVAWREAQDRVIVGVDAKGDIEIGFWVEATAALDVKEKEWVFNAEVGFDYTLDVLQGLYLAVEWMHHGAGQTGEYIGSLLGSDGKTRPVFMGIDYAVGIAQLMVHVDWSVSAVSLTNLRDPSGALVTQVIWRTGDWMELILGGSWSYGGSESEYGLSLMDAPMVPESLHGARLTPEASVSGWARFYF